MDYQPQKVHRRGAMATTTTGPAKLTAKGQRTRARIIDAAAQLIWERGVTATTLEDVKLAAEVSSSQLYHYFADKEQLVSAVIEYQADKVVNNAEEADLGTAESLTAWRDLVIAHVSAIHGQGGCPWGPWPANWPSPTRGHAPWSPRDSAAGPTRSRTECVPCTTRDVWRPGLIPTTSPSPCWQRCKVDYCSLKSIVTSVHCRPRWKPS